MRPFTWLAVVPLVALADPAVRAAPQTGTAIVAAGCFWCVEADLAGETGVLEVETGYAGGVSESPTFRSVVAGGGGHLLAVRITFDPARISYERLLVAYYLAMDPTDRGGQACERGASYAPAVFYIDEAQHATADRVKSRAAAVLRRPIAVAVRPAGTFWRAEEQNQDYALRNPLRYDYYRRACGRDARVAAVWRGAATAMAGNPSHWP